jgi:PKD repeat protein
MKRQLQNIFLIVITGGLLFIPGCKEDEFDVPPASTQADFSYTSDNEFLAPTQLNFTDQSIKAVSWSWDFGNGTTSTAQNPVSTYDEGGIYTVILTVEPENNVHYNQLTKEVNILIKSPGISEPKVLFYSSRATGKVHYVILDTLDPVVFEFPTGGLYKPYGIAVDDKNRKVYVTDTDGFIYRYDFDGANQEVILDESQEPLLGSPYGIIVVDDKIYWGREGGIFMANLDGTDAEPLFESSGAPEWPLGLAWDSLQQKIFFVNDRLDFSGGVWTVNIDGSGLTEIIAGVDAGAISLDLSNSKLYYVDWVGGVFMANLDGSGVANINPSMDQNFSWGITVDPEDGYLYVADKGHDIIIRSGLAGESPENWIAEVDPYAMTIFFPKK